MKYIKDFLSKNKHRIRLLKLFIWVSFISFVLVGYMSWMFYAVEKYHALVAVLMVSFFVASVVVFISWCERR